MVPTPSPVAFPPHGVCAAKGNGPSHRLFPFTRMWNNMKRNNLSEMGVWLRPTKKKKKEAKRLSSTQNQNRKSHLIPNHSELIKTENSSEGPKWMKPHKRQVILQHTITRGTLIYH